MVALAKLAELGCSVGGAGVGLDVFEGVGLGESASAIMVNFGDLGVDYLCSRSDFGCPSGN